MSLKGTCTDSFREEPTYKIALTHRLRCGEDFSLVEGDAEVDVNDLPCVVVYEDVVGVSVPQAEDVAHHGVGGHRPGVGRH